LTVMLDTQMSSFADTIYRQKYAQEGENWPDTAARVVNNVLRPYFPEYADEMIQAISDRKFMPGGRYLYAAGKKFHQTQNCLLMRAADSRVSEGGNPGWAEIMHNVTSGLMTGAGVGIVYSDLRHNGAPVGGMGGFSTGPLALMNMVNETGRHIMQGGARRSAIWAGLHWNHPDVFDFIRAKDWSDELKEMKSNDFNAVAPLDMTNISVILDDEFFLAYETPNHEMHEWAQKVYWLTVEHMLTTAEPGFSIDCGENTGENLRNACTEITSRDDSDICNLGSINLARVESKEEFARLVEIGTAFLLSGTEYSLVPYEKVGEVRAKNRRLGLGLMGVHEWLMRRDYEYGPCDELGEWLEEYKKSTEISHRLADLKGWTRPIKTRAMAPVGTIGIIGETTTAIEPLFAIAYKRRYLDGTTWKFQYVFDATAQRLIDSGIAPEKIETAYELARTPERRIAFQAWFQQYVDHGISSTLNLPSVDDQLFTHEEFGNMLYGYLPKLRGITAYPDGARGGQPLNVVPYSEASGQIGTIFEEFGNGQACVSGSCGV
jgi:ribonucleoside-diphosphate reductase alpha chain